MHDTCRVLSAGLFSAAIRVQFVHPLLGGVSLSSTVCTVRREQHTEPQTPCLKFFPLANVLFVIRLILGQPGSDLHTLSAETRSLGRTSLSSERSTRSALELPWSRLCRLDMCHWHTGAQGAAEQDQPRAPNLEPRIMQRLCPKP